MSLDSKYNEINDFYTLLDSFINTHGPTTDGTENRKTRIMNNVNQLYNKYLETYNKNYDNENVKDEEKRGRDYKQFEIIDNRDEGPKSTKKEETETKKTIMG